MGESGWKELLAGGCGGICVVLTGHPFDTIKVLLQSSTNYHGTFHAIRRTFHVDGVKGFYRGMSTILIGVAPIFALQFWSYEKTKHYLISRQTTVENQTKTVTKPFVKEFDFTSAMAGAMAGVCTTTVVGPGERIKCLLQTHNSEKVKKFSGPFDVVGKLLRNQGISGVVRGSFLTLCRDVPGTFVYFGVYETMKRMLYTEEELKKKKISILKVMIAGASAGMMFWVSAMPQDVIKSRVQSTFDKVSSREIIKSLYRKHGASAFFRGSAPVTARAIVVNAACFLGYEMSFQFFTYLETIFKK
ncbi:hypothetical protein SNEBB_007051 [Seison nebaliae]|nr:hypothetical protein SNEBB_007051 [Seison nebaliae]